MARSKGKSGDAPAPAAAAAMPAAQVTMMAFLWYLFPVHKPCIIGNSAAYKRALIRQLYYPPCRVKFTVDCTHAACKHV